MLATQNNQQNCNKSSDLKINVDKVILYIYIQKCGKVLSELTFLTIN
jgi:hypothetical protein